jgi:hypothetical protein
MRTPLTHSLRGLLAPRHLAWLLCLALVLPLAQGASVWHGLSHGVAHAVASSEGDADGPLAAHAAQCDLCLLAAAVGGGSVGAQAPALSLLAVRHAAPSVALRSVGRPAPLLAYRSRAPPLSWF